MQRLHPTGGSKEKQVRFPLPFLGGKSAQFPLSFLQSANLPVRLSTRAVQRSPLLGVAESQLKDTVHFDKVSIRSPRLRSIFPIEAQANAHGPARHREHPLSPPFLPFHEQGDFSLPYLPNVPNFV